MKIDLEQTLARLQQDFIENTKEKLDGVDHAIDQLFQDKGDRGEFFFQLQRDVHSLKGTAGTFGFNSVTVVAHRLEDFLESHQRLSKEQWLGVQAFLDAMRAIIEKGIEPSDDERMKILSRLPFAKRAGISGQKQKIVTVVLVMPKGVQRALVGSELSACGFDVSFAENPLEAVGLAITLKPQVVLSNFEFPEINGCELARILQVIGSTLKIPFALMTSHEEKSGSMADIPDNVQVIRKGPDFVEKITEYLMGLGLFGESLPEPQGKA
ncbi:MAG: response regulator [Rhodospirillales bacterium]|nr:response regulator [Rhodospirillales bacterium]